MKCPICKNEVCGLEYRPFCSKRCADVDLGNWFTGQYKVPAEELDQQDLEELEAALQQLEEENNQ